MLSAVHVYSHLSCWAHVLDQCAVCILSQLCVCLLQPVNSVPVLCMWLQSEIHALLNVSCIPLVVASNLSWEGSSLTVPCAVAAAICHFSASYSLPLVSHRHCLRSSWEWPVITARRMHSRGCTATSFIMRQRRSVMQLWGWQQSSLWSHDTAPIQNSGMCIVVPNASIQTLQHAGNALKFNLVDLAVLDHGHWGTLTLFTLKVLHCNATIFCMWETFAF